MKALSVESATVAIRCIDTSIDALKERAEIADLAPLFDARRELSTFTESGDNGAAKKPKKSGRTALGSRSLDDSRAST